MPPSTNPLPPHRAAPGDFSVLAPPDPRRKLLGLDPGARRIGVAISNPERSLALPLEAVHRSTLNSDLNRLREIAAQYEAGGVILGLPLRMDGSEGRRAQSVRSFARNLNAALNLPLAFWDERLSTQAARRMLKEARLPALKGAVDRLAAVHILQGALDRMSGSAA